MNWLIFIGILAIGLGIGYGIRRHEVGKKAAARDFLRGVTVMVISIIILFSLYFLAVSLKVNKWMIVNLILIMVVWIYQVIWLQRKRKAGPILLDIGRTTQHKVLVIAGGLFIFAGIVNLIELFEPGSKSGIRDLSGGILSLSLGVIMIFWGLSHFEIRERGFLSLDSLVIKWGQIKSYQWEGKNNLTLVLRLKKGLMFFRTRSFKIPAHHMETVKKLLEQYLRPD
jgi:hypothetical protein